jgi:methyltransferase
VIPAITFVLVFLPMLAEARVSAAHERTLRRAGAFEPSRDVYRAMQILYPGAFLVMIAEGFALAVVADAFVICGTLLFLLAKGLKYWAIATLGARWTFRVLVPPGSVRSVAGPYRWVHHPNYIAVAGELAGVGLAMHAWYTGVPAIITFMWLMLRRVRIEERALAGVEE